MTSKIYSSTSFRGLLLTFASILVTSGFPQEAASQENIADPESRADGVTEPPGNTSTTTSTPGPISGKELVARASPSVVLLQVENVNGTSSAGTGFFINSQGWLATNHHVIASADSVTAVLESGRTIKIEGLITTDEENDIAILQASGNGHPFLALGDSDEATGGSNVAIIGNPGGNKLFSNGFIRGTEVLKEGNKVLVTDAAVDHGSSGSPLIEMETGEVVGIITSMVPDSQGRNYAAPVNRLHDLLKSVLATSKPGPYPAEGSFGSGLLMNLGISSLFFVGFYFLVRWLMVVNA